MGIETIDPREVCMAGDEGGTPPERRRREKRSEVRARILSVAYGIFAERGYEGASLERVAEAASFSKGAVYSNFASKDELFYELIAARIDERAEAIKAALGGSGGAGRDEGRDAASPAGAGRREAAGAARLAGERLRAISAADPGWQMLFVEFWLRCARSDELREKFAEKRRAMRAAIADLVLEEAAASGAALGREEAMDLATTVLALSNGLGIEALIDPEAVRPGLLGELLARIAAPGLRA
jgi:AcrR family transcriptional regulator